LALNIKRIRLKDIAEQRIEILFEQALETAKKNLTLAQRQIQIARRIAMKYNIRLPYEKRQLVCRGCKKLIIPGLNATVRLGRNPKAIRIRCLECGHIYRRPLSQKLKS